MRLLLAGLLLSGCGPVCTAVTNLAASRLCVPDGGAAANQALALTAETCDGCGVSTAACTTSVSDSTVTVLLTGQRCTMTGACPALCQLTQTRCDVGPLDAGTYTFAGAATGTLVVVPSGGATSCANGIP